MLRKRGVVGKFVEFFGPSVKNLSLTDRATIANMSPEYGATMGYFPVDEETIKYLKMIGAEEQRINMIEKYLRAQGLFRSVNEDIPDPVYSGDIMNLDLSTIKASVSGPKRPHDLVEVAQLKNDFNTCMTSPVGFKGFDIAED